MNASQRRKWWRVHSTEYNTKLIELSLLGTSSTAVQFYKHATKDIGALKNLKTLIAIHRGHAK